MKRIIAATMAVLMLFGMCACGKGTAPEEPAAKTEAPETTDEKSAAEEIMDTTSDDDPVDVYRMVMDYEGVGAQAYIDGLQAENPDRQYHYYSEEYYIETITEGERKEALASLKDTDSFFGEIFESEYPGLHVKTEVNPQMNELTFHFDRATYESQPFVGFAVLLGGMTYLDALNAYELVPPETRQFHFVCVDENGEVLMDSNDLG